jgi:hypothetical protein
VTVSVGAGTPPVLSRTSHSVPSMPCTMAMHKEGSQPARQPHLPATACSHTGNHSESLHLLGLL